MTVSQYVYQKLKNQWTKDVNQRIVEVPEPIIVFEKEDFQERLSYKDVVRVIDGGIQDRELNEVGADAERIVTLVNLDLRSADRNRPTVNGAIGSAGRVRMHGYRDEETLEKERYGGLVGECIRVLQLDRKRDKEFDLIETPEVNDISNQTGKNHFRVQITARFTELASEIDPEV